MKVQRLRFRYSLGRAAIGLGQRELIAAWEHACKAAELPLAYSEGKRPSPLISVAAPLPQSVTSDCELVDLMLSKRIGPSDAFARIETHFPVGIRPLAVEEVGVRTPSLQSQVRWAEYEIRVQAPDLDRLRESIGCFLEATTLPAEYQREKTVRAIDLRPLVLAVQLIAADGEATIVTRLRADPERTARADLVASALGVPGERRIHRARLVLEEVPAALLACRRLNGGDEV